MKNLTFLITFLVLISKITFSQWNWVSPLPTGNDLMCTSFISPDTGFIYSNEGEVFKTTNGGFDWNRIKKNPDWK